MAEHSSPSSPSPTTSPVTIDYLAFPHIIDLILDYADPSTRFNLSLTTSHIYNRISEQYRVRWSQALSSLAEQAVTPHETNCRDLVEKYKPWDIPALQNELSEGGLLRAAEVVQSGSYRLRYPTQSLLLTIAWLHKRHDDDAVAALGSFWKKGRSRKYIYHFEASPGLECRKLGYVLRTPIPEAIKAIDHEIQPWGRRHEPLVRPPAWIYNTSTTSSYQVEVVWVLLADKFAALWWPLIPALNPNTIYTTAWKTDASALMAEFEAENKKKTLTGNAKGYLGHLVTPTRDILTKGYMSSPTAGQLIRTVEKRVRKWGADHASPNDRLLHRKEQATKPPRKGVTWGLHLYLLRTRLEKLQPSKGILDPKPFQQGITAAEAMEHGNLLPIEHRSLLRPDTPFVPWADRLIREATYTPLAKTTVRDPESLYQFVATFVAASFADSALGTLMARTYIVFLKNKQWQDRGYLGRRSTMWSPSKAFDSSVRFTDLPWIAAAARYRHRHKSPEAHRSIGIIQDMVNAPSIYFSYSSWHHPNPSNRDELKRYLIHILLPAVGVIDVMFPEGKFDIRTQPLEYLLDILPVDSVDKGSTTVGARE